ncbi:MAG: PIN domain-containing protein [Verrucomicrobiales bacterium]
MKSFVDTNVLLYAVSHDPTEKAKAKVARELLLEDDLHLSIQTISEFLANAIKPRKLGMSRNDAALFARAWEERYKLHPLTVEHLELAHTWFLPGTLSWWDSLIIASSNLAGCGQIYSEDLHPGAVYGQVKVINPFAALICLTPPPAREPFRVEVPPESAARRAASGRKART